MILYRRDDIVYFEDGTDKIYVHISDLSIKDLGANKAEIQIEYLVEP